MSQEVVANVKRAVSYPDVIDRTGTPAKADMGGVNLLSPLFDAGSYHAYGLPAPGDVDTYGGFTGPLAYAQESPWYLSKALTRLQLRDAKTGAELALPAPTTHSYPGRISQTYEVDGVTLTLDLRFVSQQTALVTAEVSSAKRRALEVSWTGDLMRPETEPRKSAPSLRASKNGVEVRFEATKAAPYFYDGTEALQVRHADPTTTVVDGDSYVTTRDEPLVATREAQRLAWTETYTFTEDERLEATVAATEALRRPDTAIRATERRWDGYVKNAVEGVAPEYRRVAVKSVETLVNNWRGPAGQFEHSGMVPSTNHKIYSGGYWPWDMFKQAVGTTIFSPELARDIVLAEFENQFTEGPDAGMIPDVVGFRTKEQGTAHWNARNTKPPLAAWAAWEVYASDPDQEFLAEIYPKLKAERDWWFSHRDHDKNLLLEYGASMDAANNSDDAARLAAAWESGMDDGPRFDFGGDLKVVHNTDAEGNQIGYSLNQESVDLNAFMSMNTRAMAKLADKLGKTEEAAQLRADADAIDQEIRDTMYDPESGWFYDKWLGADGPRLDYGKSIEGIIPLMSGTATREQADRVRENALDPTQFNTFVPLPPISAEQDTYDPDSYTRGSAWPDQVGFAVTGFNRYGLFNDAELLRSKLFANATGLGQGDEPIWEKYDSSNGDGNNTPNFSWSAAGILTMVRDTDQVARRTTAALGLEADAAYDGGPVAIAPGEPIEVTSTFQVTGSREASDVSVALSTPKGWSATPSGTTTARKMSGGTQLVTRWKVTAPESVETGTYRVKARAEWSGRDLEESTTSALLLTVVPPAPQGTNFVSDLEWVSATNGWGPVERDTSVGDSSQGDGNPIAIGGTEYAKGLGAHANSDIVVHTGGQCSSLTADVGIDDESGDRGSVTFAVLADGKEVASTGVLRGGDPAEKVDADVTGASFVTLRIGNAGDGNSSDHADWAAATLTCDEATQR
ncbi:MULTISPECIES: MGH1-like glycoside hydrolase domain-containing protein [unclassified Isoptericola]|uniref:MGH1-like glycoside hydrolase domain-containing protein n=1 Tax=unclassified Isoptericola TaxID=2623355 RepID=UPI00364BC0DD